MSTSIEWTDATWNPIVGCSRVSKGCEHCYAERVAHRGLAEQHRGLTVMGKHGPRWNGTVRFVADKLAEPLGWRKPRRVFVNSMSDLFHEGVSDEQIAAVFGVMAATPQHTYQILTKRPERARAWFEWIRCSPVSLGGPTVNAARGVRWWAWQSIDEIKVYDPERPWIWPLPNVWLGVSVEDQATADERIPLLLDTPAAIRWVSYEPALGAVDFGLQSATCSCCDRWPSRWVRLHSTVRADELPNGRRMSDATAVGVHRAESNRHGALSVRTDHGLLGIKPSEFEALPGLDWIVIGGESGHGARPFDLAWARDTIRQARGAGVPCFVKQLGARPVRRGRDPFGVACGGHESLSLALARRGTHGIISDRKGKDPSEWPEDLRVREWPGAARP